MKRWSRLPRRLAPKEELKLEVFYSGLVALSGERLERIGAPTISAERSDWDRVSADFIGLRGFGNVVWYPVSAPPVLLGDGAKLFTEIGRQKQRQQQARVSMTVTSEYSADAAAAEPRGARRPGRSGDPDSCAGEFLSRRGDGNAAADGARLLHAQLIPAQPAKGRCRRTADIRCSGRRRQRTGLCGRCSDGDAVSCSNGWERSRNLQLTVVGLPDPGDIAAEEGAVFFTGFKASPDPKELETAMVHSLAHAYFRSPRVWLE